VLTCVAMLAFAANSLLARAALAGGAIDAVSFTVIRLASGAGALVALMAWQRGGRVFRDRPGNFAAALCLLTYGFGFSLAYLRLGAATGALILFASVQACMIAWGVLRGQRPGAVEFAGLIVAFSAFVYLLLPGLHTPDGLGSLLMMGAGIAWGAYSLRGRGGTDPLGETAGNFARATLICLPLAALSVARGHASNLGVVLALTSGVVTSGLGYAIWYRVLPRLKPVVAASVQLTVPLIATVGGLIVLQETLSVRLVVAGVFILGGVGLTIVSHRR